MSTNANASWGAGADKSTSKSTHNYNLKFVSGYGQFHSNEPTAKNPKQYDQIDLKDIRALVDNPQQVDKSQAQWLIPSTLPSRVFKEQEASGEYYLLWADIDKYSPDFDKLVEIVKSIFPGHDFEAYTTSSATEDSQKARILVLLNKPLSFEDWMLCQQILNDLLKERGITPDRANERAAQLCYLPNRGEFYKSANSRNGEFFNPLEQWLRNVQIKRDTIKAAVERLNAEKDAAESRRKALISSDADDNAIGAFNKAYSVIEILLQAGYEQRGDSFRHPASISGSFSASVKDGRVHSLSCNDPLYTGGSGGGAHDAFSAFTVLFCDGDQNVALREAGDIWLTIDGVSWNRVKQQEHMNKQEEIETISSLDDLPALDQSKNKQLGKIIDYPPGLAGDIARYIFNSSRMPIKSFAIVGALTFLSHVICNNAYVKPSNTALNLYQVLVGNTGCGKEDVRKAVKRLIDELASQTVDSIHESMASGVALLKVLQSKKQALILIDEFGLYLQSAISERGSIHQKEFIKELMTLYGLGRSYYAGRIYADSKRDIKRIDEPYVNLLGTTTPLELLDGLTAKTIDNGFLNRLLIINASGQEKINRQPDTTIPEELRKNCLKMLATVLSDISDLIDCSQGIGYKPGAHQLLIQLVEQTSPEGHLANLWRRSEEQTIRVAGLIAVADGSQISCEHVNWAWDYVSNSINQFAETIETDLCENPFQKLCAKALLIIKNPHAYASDLQFAKFCKRDLMPRGKLTKLLKIKPRDLDDVLNHLVDARQVSHGEFDGRKCYKIL